MLGSPPHSGGCDVRLSFVSDTHIGLDGPARPRVVRRRRGDDFSQNLERALEPARTGEVDVHEGLHVFDRPRSVVLDAGGVRAAFIGFGDRSTCCRSQAGTDVDPSTRAARDILNSAGETHSSLSARRRNSSGTERTTRNADP